MMTETLPVKKKIILFLFGCFVVVGWHSLWWLACSVVASEVAVAIGKKKKKIWLFEYVLLKC
jgi:hypothetical protein